MIHKNLPFLFFVLLLFYSLTASAQHLHSPVAETVATARATRADFEPFSLLALVPLAEQKAGKSTAGVLAHYEELALLPDAFDLKNAPETMQLQLPGGQYGDFTLDLVKARVLTEDFTLLTSASQEQPIAYSGSAHYRGVVAGDAHSVVAISIMEGEVMGAISSSRGTFSLGRLEAGNKAAGRHLLYRDNDLLVQANSTCETATPPLSAKDRALMASIAAGEAGQRSKSTNCVRVYLELDYTLVTEKGGAAGAMNWIAAVWNQVATLYQNENITTELSQVFAWTSNDPYPTNSTSSALNYFRATRTNFNGDLAHLISRGAPAGGGVAYVNALCTNSNYAYSYVYGFYSNVPVYSWTVNVIAHEMGHNLGSFHTHDCVWNGNNTPIDGCGPQAGYAGSGGCSPAPLPPSGGGTIMSYCHLLGNVGIGLSNGFGPQPGNLIRARVDAASCLSGCAAPDCFLAGLSSSPASCNAPDGTATVNINGGSAPFTYLWSSGATTATATGLAPGTYTVTVTDATTCSEVHSVTVGAAPRPVLTMDGWAAAGSANGRARARTNGGTPPYTYLWNTGATTNDLQNLVAGTYTVTVTDNIGCTDVGSFVVADGAAGCTNGTVLRLTIQADQSPGDIYWGLYDDQAQPLLQEFLGQEGITAGGLYSYVFCLPDGCYAFAMFDGQANGICNAGSNPAGYFELEDITNGGIVHAGCDYINVNARAFCLGNNELLTLSSTDASCAGAADGTATVSELFSQGTTAYTWSNGGTSPTITGLAAGTYSVTVTNNLFVESATVTISAPALLALNISANNPTQGNNGTAAVSVVGGTSPYTYAWSTGATTAAISNLAAGSYQVTVTDANGCSASASVELTDPGAPLVINLVSTDVSCNKAADGTSLVTATGGTGSYTYAWNTGATSSGLANLGPGNYTVTVTSGTATATASATITEPTRVNPAASSLSASNGMNGAVFATCTGGVPPYTFAWSNGATTANVTGLAPGQYTVTATDATGCTGTITVTVSDITPLVMLSLTYSDVSCNGASDGSATVTATGGTGTYTYLWSNGATQPTVSNLASGTYTVTVTSFSQTATSSVTIGQPAPIQLSITSNNSAQGQATGNAMVTPAGGTSPYTYLWSSGSTWPSATGLAAGVYTVTVTDAGGCTATGSATIGEYTPGLEVLATATDVSCHGGNDGTAEVQAFGGVGNYAYLWSNGATTPTVSGLTAGTYFVTVTSGNQTNTNGVVVINEPGAIVLNATVTDATNGANGSVTISVGGGNAPYAYLWSNGATAASVNGLAAGNYSVTVTDANGCTASQLFTVNGTLSQIIAERGRISVSGDGWQTVTLAHQYSSPVVVATPIITGTNLDPVVTRVRNAGPNSFQIRVQRPGAGTNDSYNIEYLVVEEGVYDFSTYGITMEAVLAGSTRTAARGRWGSNYLETRSYQNTYANPVVLGQVMSHNDADFSVFWASQSGTRSAAPSSNSFAAGKQVSEDSDRTRANETIGYIVIEAGNGTLNGEAYEAGVGSDIVRGQQNSSQGYLYNLSANLYLTGGVLSSAGIDSGEGGWPVFKADPIGAGGFRLAIEEDQLRDSERGHTTEEVAYLVFGLEQGNTPASLPTPTPEIMVEATAIVPLTAPGSEIQLFPNPATDYLTVVYPAAADASFHLTVWDMAGRKVVEHKVSGTVRERLEVSHLQPGMYLLDLRSGTDRQTKRFIVN